MKIAITAFICLSTLLIPCMLKGQEKNKVPDGTDGTQLTVPASDSTTQKTDNMKPNEINTPVSTVKLGMGFIYDFTTYIQDDVFKRQVDSAGVDVKPHGQLRDFRILASGLFKTKRAVSWKAAYMYDGDKKVWLLRETGITIAVPELAGHIFVGRTKEGFSMIKVMNGHSPWTNERPMAIDVIPILADGIKWFGFLPKPRIFWNLGYYNDVFSRGQSFSTFEWQYVARVGWMPFYDKENNKLIHIAANLRYAKPLNGQITMKSRPESNPTPQLINTGVFKTDHSSHTGIEAYYSNGRLMLGTELVAHNFYSKDFTNHTFYGGSVVLSRYFTKTYRPYNTVGSIYGFTKVRKSVFKGGIGELEGILVVSTLNLNDKEIKGGQFTRITPMINWYLSKTLRLEFIYGYGIYDRFTLSGNVQFFECRFQITIM